MDVIDTRTPEHAAGAIAALAAKVIASSGHPHHTLTSVGEFMTSDIALDTIIANYERRLAAGKTKREAFVLVGQGLVSLYCKKAHIPTDTLRLAFVL